MLKYALQHWHISIPILFLPQENCSLIDAAFSLSLQLPPPHQRTRSDCGSFLRKLGHSNCWYLCPYSTQSHSSIHSCLHLHIQLNNFSILKCSLAFTLYISHFSFKRRLFEHFLYFWVMKAVFTL